MIVFILTIDSDKWKWETKRQLFPLGKEKIIERLQRQLDDRNIKYAVVTDDIDIMAASKKVFPIKTLSNIYDILKSVVDRVNNDERVVVMFSGAVFSGKALDTIINYNGNTKFFGKENHSVAISMSNNDFKSLDFNIFNIFSRVHTFDDYTTEIDTYDQYKEFVSNVVNAGKLDDTLG
jgi:hypothetical protein